MKSRPPIDEDEEGKELIEFDTLEQAYAYLREHLDPGASIDIHEDDCSLAFDGPACTCVPTRLVGGYEA